MALVVVAARRIMAMSGRCHKLQRLDFTCLNRCLATSTTYKKQPVLGLRREETSVWERRAPLNPNQIQSLVRSGVKVLIQSSTRRAYSMLEYVAAGAVVSDDLSEADTIVGVKEVPIEHLIPDKTYIFFSHTIKAQEYNMPMLDEILAKRIRLIDYEKIVDEQGFRLVAFGKYAGVCGMINILHGLGLRLLALGHHTPFMHVGAAHNYASSSAAKAAIAGLGREIQYNMLPDNLGPIIVTFVGAGNVSQGAQEVFKELPHEYVAHTDLAEVVEQGDMRKIYGTVVDRAEHLVRADNGAYSDEDFAAHPEEYDSTFFDMVARYSTVIVNGIYWAAGMPRLITTEQCRQLHPHVCDIAGMRFQGVPNLPQRLLAIADISADLHGSLEFVSEYTTIDSPFSVYNAHTEAMSSDISENGIVLQSISNLPAQLPREATDYFGSRLLPYIKDCLNLDGSHPLEECSDIRKAIKDAVITYQGSLTDNYKYIEELRRKNEATSH